MIRRVLADDMAAHPHWWQTFGALCVLFAAIVASLVILTACQVGPPCSNHGGVHWTNAKVYQCNDGTWELCTRKSCIGAGNGAARPTT